MAKPFPFTEVVRRFVGRRFPSWKIVDVLKGADPMLTLRRPPDPRRPRAAEDVAFQKISYLAIRVNFWAQFEIPSASGKGGFDTLRSARLEPQIEITDAAAMEAWLEGAAASIERTAEKLFRPFAKSYGRLDGLLGRLMAHYAAWMKQGGKDLDLELFRASEGTEKVRIPAEGLFRTWLKERGHLRGLPLFDPTVLWRFWTTDRPMRREEYFKGEYTDCVRCGRFSARGTPQARRDRTSGTHFVWVCARCS